jgi:hypothetical protein
MPTYTDDERELAVSRYLAVGCNAAAQETKIPSSTIHRWAVKAGANEERPQHVQAAIEARMAQTKENLSQIALAATEAVLEAIERDGADVKCRDAVGAWTRAIHDYQLLTGQATERVGEDPREQVREWIDELKAKKLAKEAA